jgi:diguanylate cyclase (GGDEF)-like protein
MRRRLFVLVFVVVIIPIVVAFAVADVVQRDLLDAIVEGAFGLLLTVMAILLLHLPKPHVVYHIVIAALSALLIYLVFDPVEGASRLYWCFLYTPVVSFTLGRRSGTILGAGLLAVIILLQTGVLGADPVVGDALFLRFAATYIVLGILVHVAEYARQRTHHTLALEHRDLHAAHEEIRRLSITDQLTKVYNRLYVSERLPAEVERATRYKHPLSLIITDIDHFKSVNDTFGHQAGDALLRLIAATLSDSLRNDIDWVARYGGEEFLMVLPETGLNEAMKVAERLRTAVASARVDWEGTQLACTASFGVAALTADQTTVEKLFQVADRSLYLAKHRGRNRVVSGERSSPTT